MDLDAEAEWDIESIKRYEKLLMFESEYAVREATLFGKGGCSRWLCCLGERSGGGCLLTVYSLPSRLSDSDSSLCPDFDLKIIAGSFNNNYISQICNIPNSEWIAASEVDSKQISLYHCCPHRSDVLEKSGAILCQPLINPNISCSSDFIVATKHSDAGISLIDINEKRESRRWEWSGRRGETLRPLVLDPKLLAVYSTEDGATFLYDVRKERHIGFINGGERVGWRMGCSYEEEVNMRAESVAMVSKQGTVKLYDLTYLETPHSRIELGSRLEEGESQQHQPLEPRINLCPMNPRRACISGLDSRVYVVDTQPGCQVSFVHDGHEHTESTTSASTTTTSHLFYSPGGDHTLISTADNASIQCWTYNPD